MIGLSRKLFGLLSVALVGGYFIVGLWPFAFWPRNQVTWLKNRSGLNFAAPGMAYDPVPLRAFSAEKSAPVGTPAHFTIELWIESALEPSHDVTDILTIQNKGRPAHFELCQWKTYVLLRAYPVRQSGLRDFRETGVRGALPKDQPRFITITGDEHGADFYLDGALARHSTGFVLPARLFDGRLILGNAATGKHSWRGRLFGLAIFNRTLGAAEVARDYRRWTRADAGQLVQESGLTALYLFNKREGAWAQDHSSHGHRLLIPGTYQVLQKEVLISPWQDYAYNRRHPRDVLVNLFGFVPFGFCFFLYRRQVKPRRPKTAALLVVLAGASISLAIEITQVWLPNRVSSSTDLLTNTAGTWLGILLAWAFLARSKHLND